VPVEILSMFIKPFALFIRLIANMTAGHVLLAVLISFPVMAYSGLERYGWGTAGAVGIGIPVVLAGVAVMCLELFVAFLQAYIFTMLTALFIGQLVLHEGDEHTGPHHDEAHETIGSGDLTDYAKLPPAARSV
jgi:F-type H+-transporting ATPase subunit a